MKKFSELEYKPVDYESLRKEYSKMLDDLEASKTYEEFLNNYLALQKKSEDLMTNISLCHIRNSIDTRDSYYDEERRKNNEGGARMVDLSIRETEILLNSPYKEELKKEFGELFIKDLEVAKKLQSEETIELEIKESELANDYSKLTANAKTMFDGEEKNFYGLLKYLEDKDRKVRKDSFIAWANLYESISDQLDNIYDEMIKLRKEKAVKLGFKDYLEYIYLYRGRYDYNMEDVKHFRDGVKKYIVPLCVKIQEKQRKELGVDKLYYYDENLLFKDGNPNPIGTTQDKVNAALKMYTSLSKETAEYFKFMTDYELFSLESTPGKRTGGYCSGLMKYKAPFIFANFNGTSADVDVLTHEAGHGFQSYLASRSLKLGNQIWSTMDIAEIYSMSMEHFAYPYMENFFGSDAKRYLYYHLANAILVIPYLVMVDDFQHQVFLSENPDKNERRKIWKQLEKEYLPLRDYDDNEFMNGGAYWMQKQHIFVNPFYYIDYALAGMVAFQFYLDDTKDHDAAFANYMKMCKIGSTLGYNDTLNAGNRLSPFSEENIKAITEEIANKLEELEKNIRF